LPLSRKRDDGACVPEVVNPTTTKTQEPRLYFSNYLNPNSDKDLYTKYITYFWQPRSCFNNANAGDDSCQSIAPVNYGQKWKFSAAVAPLEPPVLSAPPNDANSADIDNAVPIALPALISWKRNCGTNSYQYQIQELSGKSYKNLLGGRKLLFIQGIIFYDTA